MRIDRGMTRFRTGSEMMVPEVTGSHKTRGLPRGCRTRPGSPAPSHHPSQEQGICGGPGQPWGLGTFLGKGTGYLGISAHNRGQDYIWYVRAGVRHGPWIVVQSFPMASPWLPHAMDSRGDVLWVSPEV